MLSINMDDVIKVLNSIKSQLIGFGVVAVLLIAVMIACRKQSKSKKYLIRWQAGLGMVLALAITVNLILTGPMYSMVTLATGGGKVSEENVATATQLCENIADEGIVLLDNDGTLPMAKNSKLNVFGWASTNPCYGGTGSGALSDAYPTVTLLEGLKNAGFELNTELSDFYTSYRADRPVVGMFSQDWTLPEPEAAQYTDELMNNAKAFSDTAMVVITRVGGEGADLPTDVSQVTYDAGHSYNDFEPGEHYLQLSKTEKDMIDLVCKNFDKVVVVYNGANAMELGWVKDYSQIKSVVWCAGTGQSGFNALGSILCGDVNPSGRTIDTFVYDLTQTPTANNFGNFTYTNMDEFKANSFGTDTIPAFVNYVEGIYVGYKFYETAAAEGLIDYDKTVVYPFGRGLSYTTFTQSLNSVTEADGTITVDVTVTNTGSASGKEVVEVYYNPPYTNGGLEKASANLIGFAKTSELAPGASENVTVTFKAEDMASYDTYGKGCYVLEKGDYVISINADSHTVLDSKVYNVASDIVYDASNKRESDVEVADNKFDFAEGNVTYLSRANGFANYAEATAAPADFELQEAEGVVVEQVIRPTGLLDPEIEVRPSENQIDDLMNEILIRCEKDERVLVTTLTKRMAEELTEYLLNHEVRANYIHSDVATLDRVKIMNDLRAGLFDVLVGVNLLREGLDLPEVSLVAILDADKEGFLRSHRSLTQTAGRAARNVNGKVIMYADTITESMQLTIDETERRRMKQMAYNKEHHLTPKKIEKEIKTSALGIQRNDSNEMETKVGHKTTTYAPYVEKDSLAFAADPIMMKMSKAEIETSIADTTELMKKAAKNLDFIQAAQYRDEILRMQKLLDEKR